MNYKYPLAIIISTILLAFFTGCANKPIIGEWQDMNSRNYVEFMSDESLTVKVNEHLIFGTYELLGDNAIKVELNYANTWLDVFGGDTWNYSIDGTTLTLENNYNGKITKFRRLR